ncbi:hypothetical protein CDAR_532001, partial [Caerostris darwini]
MLTVTTTEQRPIPFPSVAARIVSAEKSFHHLSLVQFPMCQMNPGNRGSSYKLFEMHRRPALHSL